MGATCKKLHKQFIEINMKKLLACSLLCAFSLIANAQSIGSFLDFYLGQSISEAKIIVNSKYPSASWDNNKCTIKNVRIAGEDFKSLDLYFEHNKLTSGRFCQSTFNLDCSSYEEAKRYVDNVSPQYINMISRLYSLFKSKYGKESYSTNNTLVWRGANGNSITIELRQTVEDVGYGSYAGNVAAFLTYELTSNLGNY
jgi:hypothetical protein